MSFSNKNYPLTGSDMVFRVWKQKKEAATFKGTLLGIVVSFFILFFIAFILNLTPNTLKNDAGQVKNTLPSAESASKKNDGPVSFLKNIFGIKVAQAATVYARTDYKAQIFITSASKLELTPGEEATYRVGFKNIGKAPWLNTGANFVSIYTFEPKYRISAFQNGWYKPEQPVKMKDASVQTGQIGYIEFKLKAPQKVGEYTEIFKLAAENKAWIEGGEFTIPIKVQSSNSNALSLGGDTAPAQLIPILNPNFQGMLLLKSADKVDAKAGEVVDLRFGFKNTGRVNWDMQSLLVPDENLEDDGKSIFFYPTWPSGHEPTVSGVTVKTGEIGFLNLKIQAPEVAGTYTAKFKLAANYGHEVSGAEVEIPVYVTDETVGADQSGRVSEGAIIAEPMMEVGLEYIDNSSQAVELMSDQAYRITDKSGGSVANLSAGESVRVTYDFSNKIFTIQNARLNITATGELHFTGFNNNTIFTILSMSRSYSGGWNDNKYRDEIILRYADTTSRLWTINRLSMERYLWGIAETSNISPIEYIKSIIVASRTYALYHYLNPYKYNGYFTVRSSTADQLYRGYNSEVRSSRVVQAVNETTGRVITYQGDVVVTPYFGHSDGKTRTWSSVFGGKDKPWLQPVVTPYDAGMTMFGHGVGMSANDAYGHAKTDGWDYTRILKYYYNGIEVSKLY